MQYCGFSWALIEEATPDKLVNSTDDKNERSYNACATRVMDRLNRNPPGGWYFTAFVALFLVWIEIGMAILLAYNTPTIGLGCWSGSFLMYGILSTASWFLQLFNSRVSLVRRVSTAFNLLAFCWLVIVTFFIVSIIYLQKHRTSSSPPSRSLHDGLANRLLFVVDRSNKHVLVQYFAPVGFRVWRLHEF
jgi:hypothetical protein